MHQIEQRLYDRNLQAAWAMAGGWSLAHQERLAELVVERFIRTPAEAAAPVPTFSSNSTYTGPGCGVAA